MKIKRPLVLILWIILLLVGVPSFLIYLDTSNELRREQTETEVTQATIISTEIFNHDNANYKYTVAGKVYASGEFGWADRVKPGDSVTLHYNPKKPSQSNLGKWCPKSFSYYVQGFIMIDIFIIFLLYLVYRGLTKFSATKYD